MSTDTAVATQESYEKATEGGKGELVRLWLDAISVATNEEEDWRKQADNAVKLYRQATDKENADAKRKFNILHSNVETLVPALYNSTPVPDVRRRFSDPDPVAKQVADIQERCLSYSVDSYDFDHVLKLVVKDSELPGRAVARVRYIPYADEESGIAYQEVLCEHTPWKHFRRGPANEWSEVPWIAFELFLTREELDRLNPKLSSKVNLDVSVDHTGLEKGDGRNVPEVFKRARVWEIWDKERRKVLFIAESYKDQPIREEDDPLDLEGFFPIPRPIYGIQTGDSLIPVVPYEIYRAQAEELERISQRIIILTEAVKAKAIYDGRMTEMERLERAEDTDHISLENVAIFADGSKLNDHIWFYPIEVIVAALEKCFEAREQIKQTIYEITGISDILRGATQASETATAQNIKQQWGSLRIQQKQAEIQRFARDLFRLKAELFATKFEPQVLQMMTGIQLAPEAMQLMRSDRMRGYRVDIESDSTIRADLTRNQQNMTMFLQGVGQYAQAMGPIVMSDPRLMPAALEVFAAFARNFKLGKQAEDAIENVIQMAQQTANQPKPPDPAQQAEMQKMQLEQQRLQMDQQAQAADLQFKAADSQQKLQFEAAKHDQDMQFNREKHANEMALKQQELQANAALKEHEINTRAAVDHRKANDQVAMHTEKMISDREIAFDDKDKRKTQMQKADESHKEVLGTLASVTGELRDVMQQIAGAVAELSNEVRAPASIIRDKAGRAVGVQKGKRTMSVNRGPDGRVASLQ